MDADEVVKAVGVHVDEVEAAGNAVMAWGHVVDLVEGSIAVGGVSPVNVRPSVSLGGVGGVEG